MNDPIRSRASIASDAEAAAERFVATGVEQLNPELDGTEAHAQWAAAFARFVAFHRDPLVEDGPA